MPTVPGRFLRTAAVLLPAGAAAAHIGPAATWLPGPRPLLFPGFAGTGGRRHIALTFDDGPDPVSTPDFLDALDELGARATFFVVGERAVRHPAVVRETVRRGHELGVHGWRPRPALAPRVRPRRDEEVARTVRAVHDLTGHRPRWYRPPYGILTTSRWRAARRAGLRTVPCGPPGAGTGRPTPRRSRYGHGSPRTCAAAAPSCCTTPTGTRLPGAGTRLWAPCRP
ncbi:hypothetical protein GCM10017687_36900 [Streptomyces echinatus]|uniref:polysaccharide deacetylase family protein n=1 Tax=Streptomyces echinatus TaxID=67293 RepID=UPI003373EDBE